MGWIIKNPSCICNCECCEGECAPTAFDVTFQGVKNLAEEVCPDCSDWNGPRWRLNQIAGGSNCFWTNIETLPCEGTRVTLAIECPRWDTGLFGIELEIWEDGVFVGSFFRLSPVPMETTNCWSIGAIGGFVLSGAPDADRKCDWLTATATVTVP